MPEAPEAAFPCPANDDQSHRAGGQHEEKVAKVNSLILRLEAPEDREKAIDIRSVIPSVRPFVTFLKPRAADGKIGSPPQWR